jgi:CRP-like cAMP-binding protein
VLLAGSVGYAVRFAAIDRGLLPPRAEVELLRNLPMFAALPLVTIEQLAGALEIRVYDDGAVVMRAGEAGDRFYLITSGTARVTVHDHDLPALGSGDGFGEIALLRDVPRTATVTADGPLSTLSLDREDFLGAISRTPASARHAELLAERRLAAG